jgi:hypothetical protein
MSYFTEIKLDSLDSTLSANSDTQLNVTLYDEGGQAVDVNADGQLHVVMEGKSDLNNSTEVPLGIDGVFTGTSTEILEFSAIAILLTSDADSAIDGLSIQFSDDGILWHIGETYTLLANATKFFTPPCQAKYYRIVYTNGGVAQTTFHLHPTLKKNPIKWSSHRVQDNLNDEDDGTLQLSVLKLRTAQNTYVSGSATATGNFKVSLEELESGVSSNSNSQLNVTLFDEGGVPVSVDDSTESLQVIQYEHHEIHSGSHYHCDSFVDLSINNVYDLQITTPDTTEEQHLVGYISCESETLFEVYEDVTINVAGTTLIPVNNNRRSVNTSNIILSGISNTNTANANADTAVVGATLLLTGKIGAGKDGGSRDRNSETILKRNTKYTIRFTASVAGYVDYTLSWYEHTPN